MLEFNPDGSLKLSNREQAQKTEKENKLKFQRSILVKREVVNFNSPKSCVLHIKLSDKIGDNSFIKRLFDFFSQQTATPSHITQLNDKEFDVFIGTNFRRCTDCNNLIGRYRQNLNGSLIDEKGNCTFESRSNFSYEDYFD